MNMKFYRYMNSHKNKTKTIKCGNCEALQLEGHPTWHRLLGLLLLLLLLLFFLGPLVLHSQGRKH